MNRTTDEQTKDAQDEIARLNKLVAEQREMIQALAARPGTFNCPHCGDVSNFDNTDLHGGCLFTCEHCGGKSVIEPEPIE